MTTFDSKRAACLTKLREVAQIKANQNHSTVDHTKVGLDEDAFEQLFDDNTFAFLFLELCDHKEDGQLHLDEWSQLLQSNVKYTYYIVPKVTIKLYSKPSTYCTSSV